VGAKFSDLASTRQAGFSNLLQWVFDASQIRGEFRTSKLGGLHRFAHSTALPESAQIVDQ
jgi:hypothetical protein